MAIIKWDELQLRFDLDLDEAEEDAVERSITPEEARRISEAARHALDMKAGEGGERKVEPKWWKDYMMLRGNGWPWRVACYIAWASSPKTLRKPETLEELATTVLGLTSPRVIYTWRRKYQTIDQVIMMMQTEEFWEHRRDVLDALTEMAKKVDYKAHNDRKLYLEITKDYIPRNLVGLGKAAGDGNLAEMSDDELRRWIDPDEPSPPTPSPIDGRGEEDKEEEGDAGE